jgi:hypothetical protein
MRMPTQQSKVMKRKAREAVERERGEDNDGDNDGDDDELKKVSNSVFTTQIHWGALSQISGVF